MNRGRTILVVGTSAERRVRCATWLGQAGQDCTELETFEAAFAHVATERPALVICDVDPADPAALAACYRLKANSSGTLLLQISPVLPSIGALDAPIDAILVDPIDAAEMVTLVRSLLRLQRIEADLRDSEERLQLAQKSAGLAILDWVVTENAIVFSPNFLDMFDLPPRGADEVLTSEEILQRVHPEDLSTLTEALSAKAQTSDDFNQEYRIRLSDGRIRWILSRGRFFRNAAGQPERMLSLNSDITAQRTAEHSNGVLAAIVTSTSDAIVSLDIAGLVTSWNAGAEALFGFSAEQMVGREFTAALDGSIEDTERFLAEIMRGLNHEFEMRLSDDTDAVVDVSVAGTPIRRADGQVVGASLIMRDVSSQRQREDHVHFLMRELTHRSKNLLAVIQAMARQSLTKDIAPEEFIRRFSDRLAGLAGSHDLLSGEQWRGVSLLDLIDSQLNHYKDLFGSRILLAAEDLVIRPEAAQNIGIALHELSTNAAKYGALSNSGGQVRITWSVDDEPQRMFHLSWRESDGPPVQPPTRRGFGHTVMDRIAGRALNGRSGIRFEPDGVVWTLDVPAASAVVL